ncbi:hypothetical protein [Aneurinibacillus terranovensis]|uniref:hypothetical protein n=1 Tax=Aneurinibacillus terranovensis TaxID=278991 RepID=UPI00040389E8|nr:hypothetical protein [Aneurinibacillus terranovensis]
MKKQFIDYEERFSRFSSTVEKMLIICIIGGFLTLFASQLLLTNDAFRQWSSDTVRLEGVASS